MPHILTAAELRHVVSYDADTGTFWWKNIISRKVKPGQVAGCDNGSGYIRIPILGKIYRAHRLAWLYVYGHWPEHLIDHINGDTSDNRIANLREATRRLNSENLRGPTVRNSTGFLGVFPSRRRFGAKIDVGGTSEYLGLYDTAAEAHAAYLAAKRKLHSGCSI
jgi:hypothetical protein